MRRSFGTCGQRGAGWAGSNRPWAQPEEVLMKRSTMVTICMATVWLGGLAISAQDKYSVKVPGGLAFSEFRGYEGWEAISTSRNDKVVAMILGNPAMIGAYRAGIPGNGQPVPDGAKMAKVHWVPKANALSPATMVPGQLLNVDFMEKDSKRFADSGGSGYPAFANDTSADTLRPAAGARTRPQPDTAERGFAARNPMER